MDKTDESALALEISRRFDAPPERLFDAWVGKEWSDWLPPAGARCEVTALEPRVGGRYHVRMTMTDGRMVNMTGSYRELIRPEKLVLSWLGDYNKHETIITVTFKRDGAGTVMTLRQTGFPNSNLRDGYKQGWTGPGGSLDKLAQVLAA